IEAAAVAGAGPLRSFWSICLPLVRNGILVITILVFIGAWGEFLYAISFLSEQGLYPLSVLLVQQQGQYGTAYNNMMALGIIGAVPTIVLFLLAARKLTSGLSLGVGK
ncbi:MAG: ABC transporter permease subunit, partial [Propionicimonas sp.]|nr:ABC transporter permease subunit [Propionicimonas sp.]